MSQSQARQEADARQAHRRRKAEYHAPDWAKHFLHDDGKDFVMDVVHKISEYLDSPEWFRLKGRPNPAKDALWEMATNWRQDKRTSKDGGPAIFSAIFRYILAEIVRKWPPRGLLGNGNKLRTFVGFLVDDLDNGDGDVLSQDQMRDDVLALIQNEQIGPLYPQFGSVQRCREYVRLDDFCRDMYHGGTMKNLALAECTLDMFFKQKKNDQTLLRQVNFWLLITAEDIYKSFANAKDDWLYWMFILIRRNQKPISSVSVLSSSITAFHLAISSIYEHDMMAYSAIMTMSKIKALPVGSDDLTVIRVLRENATRQLEHATSDKRRREIRDQIATLNLEEDDINESETDARERQKEE